MARTEPMTLDMIQREIHALYQNGIDVPASSEDDYKLRIVLINKFIGDWELTDDINWRELLDVGTGTIDTSAPTITPDKSFREVSGKVWLTLGVQRVQVPYLSQERLDDDVLPPTYCYISGKTGSKILNFVGVPSTLNGAAVSYRFQRYATQLTDPGDIPDMRDPRFIVSSVVARLFQLGRNNTGYTVNFNDAQSYMASMKTANMSRAVGETELPVAYRIKQIGTMGR